MKTGFVIVGTITGTLILVAIASRIAPARKALLNS